MNKFSSPFLAKSPLNNNGEDYTTMAKRIFPQFEQATDTVIVGRSPDLNMAKRINMYNRQKAALDLANMSSGNVRGIDLANKEYPVTTRDRDTNIYNVYSLVDKNKAKNKVN